MRPISFEEAKRRYPHRFTMEYVPAWSHHPLPPRADGTERHYAPQYRTDREWYDKTLFPGEGHVSRRDRHCYSAGQSFPVGLFLTEPYRMGFHR
jgi:hypothetical protein